MEKEKVLVFDFDGVLARTYTHPELHYPQIPKLIKDLSQKYILCVASFNPKAIKAIEAWDLHHYIICIRAGANGVWTGDYKEDFGIDMTKSKQILDMLIELDEMGYKTKEITFFDDTPKNIAAVNETLPSVKTVLINQTKGVTINDII